MRRACGRRSAQFEHRLLFMRVVGTAEARARAEIFGAGDRELLVGSMPRVTPLDPTRQAQDLLEDRLDGIRGRWLLYREHADYGVDLDDGERMTRSTRSFSTPFENRPMDNAIDFCSTKRSNSPGRLPVVGR